MRQATTLTIGNVSNRGLVTPRTTNTEYNFLFTANAMMSRYSLSNLEQSDVCLVCGIKCAGCGGKTQANNAVDSTTTAATAAVSTAQAQHEKLLANELVQENNCTTTTILADVTSKNMSMNALPVSAATAASRLKLITGDKEQHVDDLHVNKKVIFALTAIAIALVILTLFFI